MAIQLSTGLRNHCLATGSFKAAMDGGLMYWYAGTPPAGADDALSGQTQLVIISVDGVGTGLNFAASAAAGVLAKSGTETWEGTVGNGGGLAAYFRFVENLDDPTAASTTAKRFQGTIGATGSGADIELTDPTLVDAANQPVDSFNVTLPAACP